MRRRARNAPAAEAAEEGEQLYQDKVPPAPPHKRRGRDSPRADATQ